MKFPKTIFVKIDGDKPDEYLLATDDAASMVTTGEKAKIATYRLVEIREAEGTVQFKKPR